MGRYFPPTKVIRYRDKRRRAYNIIKVVTDKRISCDGRPKKTTTIDKFNKSEWEYGVKWFDEGFKLEDADDKYKNNDNFIRGFEYAKRLCMINKKLEDSGREWFINGNKLDDASPSMLESEHFVKGFNDAKLNAKIKILGS